MIYDNESIAYYLEHVRNIDDFIQANDGRAIVCGRGNRNSREFVHAGQVHYKEIIVQSAPIYQGLPNSRAKTNFANSIVEDLIREGYIFVQCDRDRGNQHFVYNMDNQEARMKVRRKISEAIRFFIRTYLRPHDAVPIPEANVVAEGNELDNVAPNLPVINNMEEMPILSPPENEMEHESNTLPEINNMEEIPVLPPPPEMEYDAMMEIMDDLEFDIHAMEMDDEASNGSDYMQLIFNDGVNDPDWNELFANENGNLPNERIDAAMDRNEEIDQWNEILDFDPEWETQMWEEALRDLPEINTDHINYNVDSA
ncbi:predicted protein [Chaetoceros tenuissimus]|uniref:DUF6824 domain-containing protein n=1 Tax=Chaetoceros tenuissimus TaxID=426638 RepID=A0AAD3HFM5_9STRA|nr:predicted protein [Chaetoceros tenuissimus]